MDCSSSSPDACALPSAVERERCPGCGRQGKSVTNLTVKSLVRDHTRVSGRGRYWFCRAPQCEVVYFGAGEVFRKPDIKVRVGLKEQEDPVPLCYCFDYTRADLRRDIEEHGRTEIPARIKAEVQAGFCACEVKNPAGTCCLGEITQAIQEAKREDRVRGVSMKHVQFASVALAALLLGASPAAAEITTVTFKTTRNVGFF